MRLIPTTPLSIDALQPVIGGGRVEALRRDLKVVRQALLGRRVWNINSTAAGGGVAEMLPRVLGYLQGAGIRAPWLVVDADETFFGITKRLHHALHGMPGDGGPLGEGERRWYEGALRREAADLPPVAPGDVAILHDQQVLALARPLARAGATVIFRSHVGADRENGHTARAWGFLEPYLDAVDIFVFSRRQYAPAWLPGDVDVMPPTIDPLSEKNRELDAGTAEAVLQVTGIAPVAGVPTPPLVVQVSRWDPLKDPLGVIESFDHPAMRDSDAHLVLAGPDVAGVSDDPEGRQVLSACEDRWRRLAPAQRERVHLVSLSMEDLDENFRMVNALQRSAAVVVQKSLAEGFGLTVTEAMWKARPVVASAVGGIVDQIVDGKHGRLLPDASDREALAATLAELLADREAAADLGFQARERVRSQFLDDRQLSDWSHLLMRLAA